MLQHLPAQYSDVAPQGRFIKTSNDIESELKTKIITSSIAVDSLPIEISNPTGLTYDGNYFWIPVWQGDYPGSHIIRVNPTNGAIVDSIPSPSHWPGGITWDGEYLWVTDYVDGPKIFKISNIDGSIISSFPIFYSYWWAGVAWDGEYIYYGVNVDTLDAVADTCKIHKIETNTGTIIESLIPPSGYITGMTWYDNFLWYSDKKADSIYKITMDGTIHDAWPSPGSDPAGLTFIDGYLWNIDRNEDAKKIYKLGVDPTAISDKNKQVVRKFILNQNYPNPFNTSTTITFILSKSDYVTLNIYDINGKKITTLIKNELRSDGNHRINFNANDLSSGIYFYQLSTKAHASMIKKMLLVK
jgi:hypothetical protein